jgi:DNA-binding response OmpR family regulator
VQSLPTGRKPLRIIVTDDDPVLLARLVVMLREAGHGVFAAYDARAALELARYIPEVDLMITNTRIGTVETPELVKGVRATMPWLAILHIGDAFPDATGPLADVATLQEPFTSEELLAVMARLLVANKR